MASTPAIGATTSTRSANRSSCRSASSIHIQPPVRRIQPIRTTWLDDIQPPRPRPPIRPSHHHQAHSMQTWPCSRLRATTRTILPCLPAWGLAMGSRRTLGVLGRGVLNRASLVAAATSVRPVQGGATHRRQLILHSRHQWRLRHSHVSFRPNSNGKMPTPLRRPHNSRTTHIQYIRQHQPRRFRHNSAQIRLCLHHSLRRDSIRTRGRRINKEHLGAMLTASIHSPMQTARLGHPRLHRHSLTCAQAVLAHSNPPPPPNALYAHSSLSFCRSWGAFLLQCNHNRINVHATPPCSLSTFERRASIATKPKTQGGGREGAF